MLQCLRVDPTAQKFGQILRRNDTTLVASKVLRNSTFGEVNALSLLCSRICIARCRKARCLKEYRFPNPPLLIRSASYLGSRLTFRTHESSCLDTQRSIKAFGFPMLAMPVPHFVPLDNLAVIAVNSVDSGCALQHVHIFFVSSKVSTGPPSTSS